MSDADQRLDQALRALRPPARDPAFRLAVLERQARRRLQIRLVALTAAGAALTGYAVIAAPALDAALGASAGALPAAMAAASIAVIAWSLMKIRRPI